MQLIGTCLVDRQGYVVGSITPVGNDDYCVLVEPDAGQHGSHCDPCVPTLAHALITAQDMFDDLTGGYMVEEATE